MVGNNETLEHVRALLSQLELTGSITLHCRAGRIEDIEVNQRLPAPWKKRLNEAAAEARR